MSPEDRYGDLQVAYDGAIELLAELMQDLRARRDELAYLRSLAVAAQGARTKVERRKHIDALERAALEIK